MRTSPGRTKSSRAPIVCISAWRAKLARTRSSKSGSRGWNATSGRRHDDERATPREEPPAATRAATAQSQQHWPQHGPASQPHLQQHFGSSQQHDSWIIDTSLRMG